MKKLNKILIVFFSLFILISCSEEEKMPNCSLVEKISMKINGELKEFEYRGRGIVLIKEGTYILDFSISAGVFNPIQDSYGLYLELPYKKTGTDLIQKFSYSRIKDTDSIDVDFIQDGELESEITVNTNSCLGIKFSGRVMINNQEVIITDGVINHIYDEPIE